MNKEQIIKFLNSAMVQDKRDNGETFYKFNEDTEFKEYWEDIKYILYKKGFEIKDFYYNTLDSAFSDIKTFLEENELTEFEKFEDEIDDYCEADVYNHDLLNWLSSDLYHIEMVDSALKELGCSDLIQAIQYAQQEQKSQIYYMALQIVKHLMEV